VVAICPLIAGRAIKGPTAKLLDELNSPRTPAAIAEHYDKVIDGLVIDHADRQWVSRCHCPCFVTATLMTTLDERVRLAEDTLRFAEQLAGQFD
jgi:LPPG:FO 2-phospho-L-lactate transferase